MGGVFLGPPEGSDEKGNEAYRQGASSYLLLMLQCTRIFENSYAAFLEKHSLKTIKTESLHIYVTKRFHLYESANDHYLRVYIFCWVVG